MGPGRFGPPPNEATEKLKEIILDFKKVSDVERVTQLSIEMKELETHGPCCCKPIKLNMVLAAMQYSNMLTFFWLLVAMPLSINSKILSALMFSVEASSALELKALSKATDTFLALSLWLRCE